MVIATDTFNRADENPLAAPWSAGRVTGGFRLFVLTSNQAWIADNTSDTVFYYANLTWPADQYAQAVVTAMTGTGGGIGVGVRHDPSTVNTGYRVVVNKAASNNVDIRKFIAGASTALGTRTTTWTDGDVLRAEIQGTLLRAKQNGTALGADISDSAISAGNPALQYSSTLTTARLDNWEGGDFTTAPRPLIIDHAVTRASFY